MEHEHATYFCEREKNEEDVQLAWMSADEFKKYLIESYEYEPPDKQKHLRATLCYLSGRCLRCKCKKAGPDIYCQCCQDFLVRRAILALLLENVPKRLFHYPGSKRSSVVFHFDSSEDPAVPEGRQKWISMTKTFADCSWTYSSGLDISHLISK